MAFCFADNLPQTCKHCYKIRFLSCLCLYSITRTFASGKTEKMVMQCLKDLGFASGKVQVYL